MFLKIWRLKSFKIFAILKKKHLPKHNIVLSSFFLEERTGKSRYYRPMTKNFQKIKGLVFTHNYKSQKIKRIDQRT